MDNQKPMVSAIITTYKRDPYTVESAIQSVEKQTYDNIEIIVIDDNYNYSDYSLQIKQMCSTHIGVRYIKQNGNKGACSARNLGIMNAKGDFIGCLDDDDLWLPDKISKQICMFTDNTVGIVFCNGIKRILETKVDKIYNPSLVDSESIITFDDMLHVDRIGSTSHPLIRRSCFEDVGLFWEEQPARQDYEMWLRITQKYKAVGISDKLFIHTVHAGEQISKDKRKAYIGFRNVYKRYHDSFRKDPSAESFILKHLLLNRPGINIEVLYYGYRFLLTKIRMK